MPGIHWHVGLKPSYSRLVTVVLLYRPNVIIIYTPFLSTRYLISVAMHDVSPGLPYISDTGGKPPESCVFTFICCISGVVG